MIGYGVTTPVAVTRAAARWSGATPIGSYVRKLSQKSVPSVETDALALKAATENGPPIGWNVGSRRSAHRLSWLAASFSCHATRYVLESGAHAIAGRYAS